MRQAWSRWLGAAAFIAALTVVAVAVAQTADQPRKITVTSSPLTSFDNREPTRTTNAKVEAMREYFRAAPPADAAWAVFFLTGRRLKRLVPHAAISTWTMAATGLEEWMLLECYSIVGDGAETAAAIARP